MEKSYTFAVAGVSYVKEIYISHHNKEAHAWSGLFAQAPGIKGIQQDLNYDAGGDFIYLGYTTTANPNEAIRGLYLDIAQGKSPADVISVGGVPYYRIGVDLNYDAGGKYVWLYVSWQAAAGAPIKELEIEVVDKNGPPQGDGWYKDGINLNYDAGGKYVYLWYRR